jgi:hypothetical protein
VTVAPGHVRTLCVVESDVSTTNHPNRQINLDSRPARCLRHHVWMAACDDCRDARLDPERRTPGNPSTGPRPGVSDLPAQHEVGDSPASSAPGRETMAA